MQAFQTTAGTLPSSSVRVNRRIVTASAIVVALHAALIAVVLMKREPRTVAIQSPTITAELLKPDPIAVPVAIQSTPTPPLPKPVPHVTREKPKVQPRPKPTPTPLPVADAPSQHVVDTPAPAAPTPPAPTPPAPAPAAAPAQGKPTMAISAPKNVSHIDCHIDTPAYPALSRRRGETGSALVHIVVGISGKIESATLTKSTGYSRLDDAALAAAREGNCTPYREDGQPVRAAANAPFDFSLDN
ncbi:TonB family protein [Paraburkholderia sp. J76]|uniref:TonB family protein n=1 Tax=Paraburkholderia sp. J76 TaxID=2805439 RepID=UPI002ABE0BA2|nr:TonB family protein [Paraburkholderia sp. J76]